MPIDCATFCDACGMYHLPGHCTADVEPAVETVVDADPKVDDAAVIETDKDDESVTAEPEVENDAENGADDASAVVTDDNPVVDDEAPVVVDEPKEKASKKKS